MDELLRRLGGGCRRGSGYMARCPAHDDRQASLSIKAGNDGRTLLYCHAGCEAEAIVAAMGFTMADLFPARSKGKKQHRPSAESDVWPTPDAYATYLAQRERGSVGGIWTYRDSSGAPSLAVVRIDIAKDKTCRPLYRVDGGWCVGDPPGALPIYRLPEVHAAVRDDKLVWIAEGEKCAEALVAVGYEATTSSHGAKSAAKSDWSPLAGASVLICPDNDPAGEQYADDVGRLLHGLNPPARVRVLRLPGLPKRGDIVDFSAARRGAGLDDAAIKAELNHLTESAPEWTPTSDAEVVRSLAWELPEPLGRFDLPAFPIDAMPRPLYPLWPFCTEVAESIQVPVDMVAMPVLAVCGAAVAGRCEVRVYQDWWEPLNLFVVVAMEPGERKSAVFRMVIAPLVEFEHSECERLAPDIEQNRSELRILAASLKNAEADAAKGKDPEKRRAAAERARELLERIRATPVLAVPRLLADDSTPEALAKLLHEQGGRIAVLSPEGGVFEQMGGRYADGVPNLDVYLKGHAGDDIRIDRVSRPPEFVRKPALSVGLAVQPDVLRGLADKPGFRGRGLLARFLYALPASRVGYRMLRPPVVSARVTTAYERMLRSALSLECLTTPGGAQVPHSIVPDAEALTVLDQFRDRIELQMRPDGELAGLRDWASKLPGAVVRITGILHVIQHAQRGNPDSVPISADNMVAGVAVGEYLIEHAKAAFFEMGADPSIGAARRLLAWIAESRIPQLTRREGYRRLRGIIRRIEDVDRPLGLLVDHGYLRLRPTDRSGPGRNASPTFDVNPATFGQNGQNGHNSAGHADSVHSVHSVHVPDIDDETLTVDASDTIAVSGDFTEFAPDELLADEAAAAAEVLGINLPASDTSGREAPG